MSTLQQLLENPRKRRVVKIKRTMLHKKPQRKGSCLRVFTKSPKKPNSALRRVAKVIFNNRKARHCHIPGQGHTLQRHSTVLVRGCRVRDLPGVNYRTIRGLYDLRSVQNRVTSRSKYGVKLTDVYINDF